MIPHVHVIGASGRSGQALCRALLASGASYTPVVRDAGRWAMTGLPGVARVADLTGDMRPALEGAVRIASCAHARHIPAILAASPAESHVFLGSTRKFTAWPDAHGNGVLAGEAAFLASGRPGVLLHPTMIYGAAGEDNVQRLAALLRRLPLVPLPDGGRALVQPIYQGDVTRCLTAALARKWDGPQTVVIAGPDALPYADFVKAVARAAGLAAPRLMNAPAWLLRLALPFTRLPGLPRVRADELRRLLEDKAFPVEPMQALLGVRAISHEQGLRLTFEATGSVRQI